MEERNILYGEKNNETKNEILQHLLRWLKNIIFANNCITSEKI